MGRAEAVCVETVCCLAAARPPCLPALPPCSALQFSGLCDHRRAVANSSFTCYAPFPGKTDRHVVCSVEGEAGRAGGQARGAGELERVGGQPHAQCRRSSRGQLLRVRHHHRPDRRCRDRRRRLQARLWRAVGCRAWTLLCKTSLTLSLECELCTGLSLDRTALHLHGAQQGPALARRRWRAVPAGLRPPSQPPRPAPQCARSKEPSKRFAVMVNQDLGDPQLQLLLTVGGVWLSGHSRCVARPPAGRQAGTSGNVAQWLEPPQATQARRLLRRMPCRRMELMRINSCGSCASLARSGASTTCKEEWDGLLKATDAEARPLPKALPAPAAAADAVAAFVLQAQSAAPFLGATRTHNPPAGPAPPTAGSRLTASQMASFPRMRSLSSWMGSSSPETSECGLRAGWEASRQAQEACCAAAQQRAWHRPPSPQAVACWRLQGRAARPHLREGVQNDPQGRRQRGTHCGVRAGGGRAGGARQRQLLPVTPHLLGFCSPPALLRAARATASSRSTAHLGASASAWPNTTTPPLISERVRPARRRWRGHGLTSKAAGHAWQASQPLSTHLARAWCPAAATAATRSANAAALAPLQAGVWRGQCDRVCPGARRGQRQLGGAHPRHLCSERDAPERRLCAAPGSNPPGLVAARARRDVCGGALPQRSRLPGKPWAWGCSRV